MTIEEKARYIASKCIKAGMTPAGAAGVLGNVDAEGVWDSGNLEDSYNAKLGVSDAQYVREVDSGLRNFIEGCGFGLIQWTFGSRKQDLLKFAKSRGVSIADFDMQIDFMLYEMKRDFPAVWDLCCTSGDPAKCCHDICRYYENPSNAEAESNKRAANVSKWYNLVKEGNAMTIEEAKKKLVALAISQVGYTEGANNYNKYAEDPDIAKLYGWDPQNQPWCCVFVNWCFLNAFGYDIGSRLTYGGTAACNASANLFKQNAAWKSSPEVGDQIFFFVSGGINHTGIVIAVDGGTVRTVEGNSSDGVRERSYTVGSSQIAGYGRPDWGIVNEAVVPDTPTDEVDHSWKPSLLKMSNAYSSDCVVLQAILNVRHFPCGTADGFFGAKTQAAVNAAQRYYGLDVDGICGPKTWEKLLEVR